ncbi:MAG: DUF4838 domain-containing protein, partial [Planctomycetota bacterium]
MMRLLIRVLAIFSMLVLAGGLSFGSEVVVLVNPGGFSSIEEAAISEKEINWWDADKADDRACTECFAAMELLRFLPTCTDICTNNITLSSAKQLPVEGNVFILGSKTSNPLIASYSLIEKAELKTDDSFCIRAFEQGGRIITIIEGKDRVGTLYGVYEYLQKLGIRFYGLGSKQNPMAGKETPVTNLVGWPNEKTPGGTYIVPGNGTVYPENPVELPRTLKVLQNPAFLTRGFWAWEDGHGNEEFFLWMARNKMNLWAVEKQSSHLLKKLGVKLTAGGHIMHEYFLNSDDKYPYNHPEFKGDEDKPDDPYSVSEEYMGDANNDGKLRYFEAHPEWYGLRDGKRTDDIRDGYGCNYCTSNADATEELTKNLVQSLIDGRWKYVDLLTFWMLDNGMWCQCENCKAQGTCTDKLFVVVDAIFKQMEKAQNKGRLQRKVEVTSLAYHETLSPPTRPLPKGFNYEDFFLTFYPIRRCYVHSLADPACTEINRIILNDYKGWTTGQGRYYKGSIFIGEYYNVSLIKSLPVVYTKIMALDIPWYYQTGAHHLNYMHTPTRKWGTWALNQSLLAKLLWDPQANVDEFLNEYFRLYYPTTSGYARKFYEYLEAGFANIKPFKHGVWTDETKHYSLRTRFLREDFEDLVKREYIIGSDEMFALDHLKYDKYDPEINNGPDIVEMVDYINLARKEIDAALMQCKDDTEKSRLLEDEQRFAYG